MKTQKHSLILSILLILLHIVQTINAQNITADTIMANKYKISADNYYENTIFDSAVYSYEMASEIYWKYYKTTNEKRLLKNFIHCQNYYAFNISVFGYTDTALYILDKIKSLCTNNLESNNKYIASTYYCYGSVYCIKNEFSTSLEYLYINH